MSKDNKINHFEKHFDYGSILPLVLFANSLYTIYLFLNNSYSAGIYSLIISFFIYVGNNIYINKVGFTTLFNEYLEDSAAYIAFSLSTIVFALSLFKDDLIMFFIVAFYGVCQILTLSRNWIQKTKNSRGWPLALNGIFFPFVYFIYLFYLRGFGEAIFILYFVIVGVLSISEHNFLGYEEKRERSKYIDDLEKKVKKLP